MSSMFLAPSGPEITREALLEALANPHDRRILALAQEQPIEARSVVEETDIPKSTVYRRIRRLEDKGLLETVDGRLRNGHAIDRYRARISEAAIRVEGGEVHADWTLRATARVSGPEDAERTEDELAAVPASPDLPDPAALG